MNAFKGKLSTVKPKTERQNENVSPQEQETIKAHCRSTGQRARRQRELATEITTLNVSGGVDGGNIGSRGQRQHLYGVCHDWTMSYGNTTGYSEIPLESEWAAIGRRCRMMPTSSVGIGVSAASNAEAKDPKGIQWPILRLRHCGSLRISSACCGVVPAALRHRGMNDCDFLQSMDMHDFALHQALTLIKSHEERIGPLMGAKRYGLGEPVVAYSDEVKDKSRLCAAFPSLAKDLAPMAAAHGLKSLSLPTELKIMRLDSTTIVQDAFTSLIGPLDSDKSAHICASLDTEWNLSRRVGVSVLQIAPHSHPNTIYIIPIFNRILQVFLIGSSIQADLTRLKKEFNQLEAQTFNRNGLGSLEVLAEKFLWMYLSKDSNLRKSEHWEKADLSPELENYAALDVYASRLVFEKISETAPLDCVQYNTSPGTRIALLTREGGEIAAYGRISAIQTSSFAGVRIKTSTNSRVLVDIESVHIPSAAAILHVPPSSGPRNTTKDGALTLSQLQSRSSSAIFQLVSLVMLLQFNRRPASENTNSISTSGPDASRISPEDIQTTSTNAGQSDDASDVDEDLSDNFADPNALDSDETLRAQMLESYAQAHDRPSGSRNFTSIDTDFYYSYHR
ncbi:hypothetical protein B0H13DRAFT_1915396 [Mycena leptocephala]|nr:hypothetical protein B0H13DRAFT_1915396 [Mycena leptocephala]